MLDIGGGPVFVYGAGSLGVILSLFVVRSVAAEYGSGEKWIELCLRRVTSSKWDRSERT